MSRPSFDQYVAARSDALLRLAYLICGDRHLAEDLVQEVLIKAHRRWDAIEADDPEGYLRQALVRTHLSWLRRRASSEITTDTFAERAGGVAFDEAHADRDELWEKLSRLPRAQRAVLVLRYFEDLDDARIAELVGISAQTVRTHASRGLAALREVLARKADEAPTSATLVAGVRAGVARQEKRRRVVAAAGLAAVIVAVALVVSFVRSPGDEQAPIVPTPSPTVSTVQLSPTSLSAPTFPYAFGFLPAGLAPTSVEQWSADALVIQFNDGLVISQGAALGDPGDSAPTPVQINGEAAAFYGDTRTGGALYWRRDGVELQAVASFSRYTFEDLVRVAESMVPGATAGTVPRPIDEIVSVGLPAGFGLVGSSAQSLSFGRGDELLQITLLDSADSGGDRFMVDGAEAFASEEAVDGGRLRSVTVGWHDGGAVRVQYGYDVRGLTIDDLVAIYRSIVIRG